jgi:hypothetical protein
MEIMAANADATSLMRRSGQRRYPTREIQARSPTSRPFDIVLGEEV